MTETNLSDILYEISPLAVDTMNYELKIRGVQPAQAPTTKKVQLARELLREKNGQGASLLAIYDNRRRFEMLCLTFCSFRN